MKRTTITLTDELAAALQREAQRRDVAISEIVRDALATYLGASQPEQQRHVPFAALGHSGYRHTARDIKRILAEEWGGARDR
jgi:metal-responsive CopG/Arc/MetJ family transcriptional regulator